MSNLPGGSYRTPAQEQEMQELEDSTNAQMRAYAASRVGPEQADAYLRQQTDMFNSTQPGNAPQDPARRDRAYPGSAQLAAAVTEPQWLTDTRTAVARSLAYPRQPAEDPSQVASWMQDSYAAMAQVKSYDEQSRVARLGHPADNAAQPSYDDYGPALPPGPPAPQVAVTSRAAPTPLIEPTYGGTQYQKPDWMSYNGPPEDSYKDYEPPNERDYGR